MAAGPIVGIEVRQRVGVLFLDDYRIELIERG
jgi:hypothetical protein